jgi:hypothetical protein
LNQLYEARRGNNEGGELSQLSSTIQRRIESKIRLIQNDPYDIFAVEQSHRTREQNLQIGSRNRQRENEQRTDRNRNPQRQNRRISNRNNPQNTRETESISDIGTSISLGKLLLAFIGEPLASTNKFDDIQIIFYPFNQYAGFANTLNISQFMVDTRYFITQLTRYRTENVTRATNMSLHDFLNFIKDTIIDDPAAESYGIYSLYHRVQNDQTGEQEVRARTSDSVEYQQQLETLLNRITPDGSFKMPQIEFFIETLNGKINDIRYNYDQSILRIHIYDKQCSQYETQSNLLAISRNNTLRSIGTLPQINQSELLNQGVYQSHMATSREIIRLAGDLIEPVPDRNRRENSLYRLRGGPKLLKEFIMSTMPYIIFGIQGSAIVGNANLNSQQDAALSTINMLRSYRGSPFQSNGEQPGGLPLSIIPGELNIQTIGCPLFNFAQQFFIDFNTGTSFDNIYGITGLSHKITPGDFKTDLKFAPIDAYGRYDSMIQTINNAANFLNQSNT